MYRRNERVYFEDIDSYGIIHHPRVLYYFERTRTVFLQERGLDVDTLPYGLFLRQISIRFKHPLKMHDEVIIQQSVKKSEKFHFTLSYDIFREACKAVHAEIDFVAVDLQTKKMIPVPEQLRNILINDLTQ